MTFPGAIQTAIGSPSNIRIGRIVGVSPTLVQIENTILDHEAVGFVDGYVPALDDVVAVSGQSAQPSARSASWLVHGRVVSVSSVPLAHAIYNEPAGANFYTGAAFTNLGAASVSFTKTRDSTVLLFWLNLSFFTDNVTTMAEFAIDFTDSALNVTTIVVTHFFMNPAGEHHSVGGTQIAVGIPAGAVTADVMWRRVSGVAQIITDNNDRVSLLIVESDTL